MNPWIFVGFLVTLIVTGLGSCSYGKRLGTQACAAKSGVQLASTKAAQDTRDAAIEVIATETTQASDAAAHQTKVNTHESIERIRTVVVPGPCRDIDPVIVREHAESRARINAKIGSGLRPAGAGTTAASPGN
jgi:hypothetical protein